MAKMEYKALQATAKELNNACGLEIKIIGGKKNDMIKAINDAVSDLDGVPASVIDFHKEFIAPDQKAGDPEKSSKPLAKPKKKVEKKAEPETTKLGNTLDALKVHADVLKVDVNEKLSIKGLEALIFETLDSLTGDEWNALPVDTQNWDIKMGEITKAQKSATKAEPEKGGDDKEKLAPKKKAGPSAPRPDFIFTEGTNARQVMDVFDELFASSNGDGLKIKDIQDACEVAKIKSNAIRSRVSGVLKYARLPEGGEQVVKKDGLFYKKGSVPEG